MSGRRRTDCHLGRGWGQVKGIIRDTLGGDGDQSSQS